MSNTILVKRGDLEYILSQLELGHDREVAACLRLLLEKGKILGEQKVVRFVFKEEIYRGRVTAVTELGRGYRVKIGDKLLVITEASKFDIREEDGKYFHGYDCEAIEVPFLVLDPDCVERCEHRKGGK